MNQQSFTEDFEKFTKVKARLLFVKNGIEARFDNKNGELRRIGSIGKNIDPKDMADKVNHLFMSDKPDWYNCVVGERILVNK